MREPSRASAGPQHLIRITESPIDLARLVAEMTAPGNGAMAIFAGTVRNENKGRRVLFLEYEAFVPMAEHELERIAEAMPREFGACRVAIVHRLGRLEIAETSVAIVVASPHRHVALRACSEAIERLKRSVPIWKKEHFEGGSIWIEGVAGGGGEAGTP